MEEQQFLGGLTNNNQTSILERKKYKNFINEKKHELGIFFLDSVDEEKLYGFLDHKSYLVEPNPELVSFGDYAGEIVGLNYVVSIYNQFRDYYLSVQATSQIGIPDLFQGLVAKKSYSDISENYERYQNIVSKVMLEPFLTGRYSSEPFLEFNQFMDRLNSVIFDDDKKNYKITKTGYMLSPYSSVYDTGIYVDLAPQLDPSVDYEKAQIILDPNFKCFGEIANSFGFLVDQNCPWRLALDLRSENVQANILNFNYQRPFTEFYSGEYLIRTGLDDYWNLKSFYKRLYIEYFRLKSSADGLLQSALDSYPEQKWLACYLLNRLRELGELKKVDFESSDADPTEKKKVFQNMLTEAKERFIILEGSLTHGSGVLPYLEKSFSEILKKRLTNAAARSDNSDTRHATEM